MCSLPLLCTPRQAESQPVFPIGDGQTFFGALRRRLGGYWNWDWGSNDQKYNDKNWGYYSSFDSGDGDSRDSGDGGESSKDIGDSIDGT